MTVQSAAKDKLGWHDNTTAGEKYSHLLDHKWNHAVKKCPNKACETARGHVESAWMPRSLRLISSPRGGKSAVMQNWVEGRRRREASWVLEQPEILKKFLESRPHLLRPWKNGWRLSKCLEWLLVLEIEQFVSWHVGTDLITLLNWQRKPNPA